MREAPGPLAIDDLDSGGAPAVDRPRELRVDPTRRRGQMALASHEARRCRGRVAGIGLHVVERCGHGPFEGRARGLAARLHVGRFDEVVGQQLLGQLVEAVLVGRDAVVEREVERRLSLRIVLGPRRGRQGLDLGPEAILAQAEERTDGRSVCLRAPTPASSCPHLSPKRSRTLGRAGPLRAWRSRRARGFPLQAVGSGEDRCAQRTLCELLSGSFKTTEVRRSGAGVD